MARDAHDGLGNGAPQSPPFVPFLRGPCRKPVTGVAAVALVVVCRAAGRVLAAPFRAVVVPPTFRQHTRVEAGRASNSSAETSPKKQKTLEESVETHCRRCRSHCVLAFFRGGQRTPPPSHRQAYSARRRRWRRPGPGGLRLARRGCLDVGRETTGSDRSTPGLAVPLALVVHPIRELDGISSSTGAFSADT